MGHRKGDPRPDQVPQLEPEELASLVMTAYNRSCMPRCDMKDPDAVAERYDQYIMACIRDGARPGVAGMASAFGYSRENLRRIKDGETKSVPEASRLTLKRAWGMLEDLMEQYALTGKINPVSAIFLMKNNFQYRDQTETVVVKKDPYESGSPEEIAQRYLAGVAPALDAPQEIARENAPVVETVVVDQTGKVE